MEKTNQLATVQRMTPNFVQNAMESIESAMEYADILLKSKLVPNHFFEKGSDGKPDYSKGKPEAIVLVLQHGMEVGLSVTQSLQQVVPVNGLISIKGDGAKSLILTSGICDIWDEKTFGTIENGDFACEIYSKRKDGKEKTVRFSLSDAIRADLFYTDTQLAKMATQSEHAQKKANAFKYSAWYKYPTRMVSYRCIGFISRDLYPDVLQGMVTTEEAQDYREEGTVTIEAGEGKRLTLTEGAHEAMQEKSATMSKSVTDAVDKAKGAKPVVEDATVVVEKEEATNGIWTKESLMATPDADIPIIAKKNLPESMLKVIMAVKGIRKHKGFWVEALLAHQAGTLNAFVDDLLKAQADNSSKTEQSTTPAPEVVSDVKNDQKTDVAPNNDAHGNPKITPKEATDSFNSQAAKQPDLFGGVPQQENNEMPEIKDLDPIRGTREFGNALALSGYIQEVYQITTAPDGYRDIDDFTSKATAEAIRGWIQQNM